MKNLKINTQKNISAIIALALAVITLMQAGTVNSTEKESSLISIEEATMLSEIAQFLEEEAMEIDTEEIVFEEAATQVKVFDANDELVGEGDTSSDKELRQLVNSAEMISEFGGVSYYKISE